MKKNLFGAIMALFMLLGMAVPALAQDSAPIHPGGPFVPPNATINTSSFMTFDEVEKELLKLEKRSKGAMKLDIAGYTLEGRPLYIAKIGHGPQRMWIQGRIHGNEPFGNDLGLEIIKSLLSKDKNLQDKMTFWIIPSYNPDGSEAFWRGNAAGVDLNRNWWNPNPALGYTQPESQAFYWAWAEFKPHYAIDIHHQGTYFVEDTNEMTTFSIGIPVWPEYLEPQIWDTNRRMAVVGYDAVSKLGVINATRYPLINIHTAVVSSMMLGKPGPGGHDAGWKTAAMFFENRGGIGNRSRGLLIHQNVVATHAIIDAIVAGTLDAVDADRWDDIPDRGPAITDDDKWPND